MHLSRVLKKGRENNIKMNGREQVRLFEVQQEVCLGHYEQRCGYCINCISEEYNSHCVFYVPLEERKFIINGDIDNFSIQTI